MNNRPSEIAVVGSANLDLVVEVLRVPLVGETVLGGDLSRIPGGKGANQAVAAARLGRAVAMIGRVGDDEGGQILRNALGNRRRRHIPFDDHTNTPNGVALIAVGSDGDNAIVVSPGANNRLSVADVEAASDVLGAAAVTLVQLEVPLDAIVAATRLAGGTVVLNPAPAPSTPLPAELLGAVDVIVPNQTELALLAGHEGPVDVDTAADLAVQLQAPTVVVTLGALGALAVVEGNCTHIEAPEIAPVDTTAAGDSFCGALADALVRGESIVDAVRWAVPSRCRNHAALRRSTLPPHPSRGIFPPRKGLIAQWV